MDWFKKHGDTMIIIGTFAMCFWNMNEKFNERFNTLEKDLTAIKTFLIMRNIMPTELAHKDEGK